MRSTLLRGLGAVALVGALSIGGASAAWAAGGTIEDVQVTGTTVNNDARFFTGELSVSAATTDITDVTFQFWTRDSGAQLCGPSAKAIGGSAVNTAPVAGTEVPGVKGSDGTFTAKMDSSKLPDTTGGNTNHKWAYCVGVTGTATDGTAVIGDDSATFDVSNAAEPTTEPTETTEPTTEPTETTEPTTEPTEPTTEPTETTEPTTEPTDTTEPTTEPTPGPTDTAATPVPTSSGDLPITGSNPTPIIVIAAVLLLGGGAALFFRRRQAHKA